MIVKAIPLEVLMLSTKCEGLSYPTPFLKSRGRVFRNNFLEYRTKQATLFARRNNVYALFATNKALHTGPLKKLFHYAIFQKFFHIFKYINGVCFTINVMKILCHFVSINHINAYSDNICI